jgi:NADH-quinone oxidoreductase subunit L
MFPLISPSSTAMAAIALTGGVTAFYAATCALAQRDLKRALAYSTISQIGYMMLGVGAGAITAATFHLLVHAFFKALLFLGAGCVITAMHHEQDIFKMGGLKSRIPGTFWPFLVGGACLAGIPLTGGFFSKDSILAAVWLKGGTLYGGLYLLGLLTALLTSIYTFRMIYLVFGGDDAVKNHCSSGHACKVPRLMEMALIPLGLLGLFGGLINLPSYLGAGWLGGFFSTLTGGTEAEASHSLELSMQAIAGVLALAGLAIAHYRYGGERRQERLAAARQTPGWVEFFINGWCFDALYRFLFIRPYEALSGFFWKQIDEGVIDDSLDGVAGLLGRAGEGLGSWTSGRVSLYIISFAAGAAVLMAYLAWLA